MKVSNMTWEFLTECTYGDRYREIVKLPDRYQWLKTLMKIEGNEIAKELTNKGLAIVTEDKRVFVNMSKLPELGYLLGKMEVEN